MSNLHLMDESNGNGVYAAKQHSNININNVNSTTTTTTAMTNNSNISMKAHNMHSLITVAAVGAAVTATSNSSIGVPVVPTLPTSVSNEDLSQSLSEYTDADESISAPTEFLAEFLSAVMLKDYKKALKYCKLILQYEPNNSTAKEFYPLILDKLRATHSDSDENCNKSSSPEIGLELQSSDPSAGESDEMGLYDQHLGVCVAQHLDDADPDAYGVPEDNSSGEPISRDSNVSSSCGSADHSLSESVDENDDDDVDVDVDVDIDDDDDDDDDADEDDECGIGVEEDDDEDEEEEEDVVSSSGDDLPIDDPNLCGDGSVGDDGGGGVGDHCSHSSRNSSSGGEGRSRSDNTTHSYSSLLLEEEEDDIVPVNLQFVKEHSQTDLDVSNGNKVPSTSCSDSESPTEPLTQRLAAILLSKCGVTSNGSNH